ncbi:MAG TPA: hypothetical protein DCP69_07940 [Candidatus Omnitrophica bacterium]|nr:hypothetical protein [Candidatus Omnitrophota bacterium]
MYQDSMLIDDSDVFFLVCRACGAEGPSSSLPDVARMLWDVRYDSPVTEQLAQGRLETIRNLTAFVNSIADALGTPVPVTEIEGVGTCFDVVIAIRQLTAENAELKAAEAALL